MGFFDKLKEGASKAADKAKETVEITRLNTQISSKRKEIEKNYLEMGKAVYQAYAANNSNQAEPAMENGCTAITNLLQEIIQLEQKIREVKNENQTAMNTMNVEEKKDETI